jgi:hypothetical protein
VYAIAVKQEIVQIIRGCKRKEKKRKTNTKEKERHLPTG